jgi:hypothetical protein
MLIIPTFQQTSSKYNLDIELTGKLYNLGFSWNTREEAWYMCISLEDTILISGIKLVPNYLLLYQYESLPNLPEGDFFIVDNDQDLDSSDITYDNFGIRYQLVFLTTEELEEINNGV